VLQYLSDFVAKIKDKNQILIAHIISTTLEPKAYALFCSRNIVVPKQA
jgi:hypothetical protein